MNEEVLMAIEATKKIIDAYIQNQTLTYKNEFEGYQQAYFTTNEKIGSYLNIYDISNKENALAVTASGDHAFNLITNGVLNIDTFDLNKLTEYLAFGLKRAMIVKYDYRTYLTIITKMLSNNTSNLEITSIISDLLPVMDEKYRIYWQEVIDYNYRAQRRCQIDKNLIDILFIGIRKIDRVWFNNNYLLNEEHYNKLRNNIGKANLTFTVANADTLHEDFKGKKYDLILLSNILGYFNNIYGDNWDYGILELYLSDLKKITNKDGIIYFNYMFLYETYLGFKRETRNHVINNSSIKLSDLKDEEVHTFNTESDFIKDAVALLRVK